jgi:hypothetical protein
MRACVVKSIWASEFIAVVKKNELLLEMVEDLKLCTEKM